MSLSPETGPVPTQADLRRQRRALLPAVTLTGWQLALSAAAVVSLTASTVIAWAVGR